MNLFSQPKSYEQITYSFSVKTRGGQTQWLGLSKNGNSLIQSDERDAESIASALEAIEAFKANEGKKQKSKFDMDSLQIHQVRTLTEKAVLNTEAAAEIQEQNEAIEITKDNAAGLSPVELDALGVEALEMTPLDEKPEFDPNAWAGFDGSITSNTTFSCRLHSDSYYNKDLHGGGSVDEVLFHLRNEKIRIPNIVNVQRESKGRSNTPMTDNEIDAQLALEALESMPRDFKIAVQQLPNLVQQIAQDVEDPNKFKGKHLKERKKRFFVGEPEDFTATGSDILHPTVVDAANARGFETRKPIFEVNLKVRYIDIKGSKASTLSNCLQHLTDDSVYDRLKNIRAKDALKAHVEATASLDPLFAAFEGLDHKQTDQGFWIAEQVGAYIPKLHGNGHDTVQDALTSPSPLPQNDGHHRDSLEGLSLAFIRPSFGIRQDEDTVKEAVKQSGIDKIDSVLQRAGVGITAERVLGIG